MRLRISTRFLANDDALKHFVRIWSEIDGHKELTRSSGNVHEHRNSEKSVRNVLLAHELSVFAFFLPRQPMRRVSGGGLGVGNGRVYGDTCLQIEIASSKRVVGDEPFRSIAHPRNPTCTTMRLESRCCFLLHRVLAERTIARVCLESLMKRLRNTKSISSALTSRRANNFALFGGIAAGVFKN